jgi:OOP family OmpA-OmpF porin
MRLSAILFAILIFAAAAAAAWRIGAQATSWLEERTAEELTVALEAAGQDWAAVATDGLNVRLAGAAPDEASRFRALEIARQVVDARRIEDATTLAASQPLPPAPFALELLRNEADVSLIGLVPETGGRDVIRAGLGAAGLDEHVTDMLESASDPAPEGWPEALGFGLAVLAELPRAKISIAPGRVKVIAVAESDEARGALEARLRRAAPEGVALALDLSAPRPVIAPFAFDFALEADGTGRLAACSAESEAAAAAILAAARAAGLAGEANCRVGLGAPAPARGGAVVRGLDALKALGGGRFVLSDIAAELTAPESAGSDAVTEISAALDDELPEVFQLTTVMPPRMETREGARVYAPRFGASLGEDGAVRLSGAVRDATARQAIVSFAFALFGHDRVTDATVLDPELPDGWPGRVLAAVEALAALDQGKVTVTAEEVAIDGWGLEPDVADRVEALLAAKVGAGAAVEVAYNAEAAAAAELAARPRPELCADQVNAILEAGSIQFAAGSAEIVPESRGVIAAIADVLRGCPGADFEIGGHTDSQGSPEGNQRLSEARAQAVLDALRASDLPLVRLTARGFGAATPVGDNASEAGRARNRRIEFTLVPDAPPAEVAAAPAGAPAEAAAECAAEIGEIGAANPIDFAAGSAEIAAESAETVEAIGQALAGCPEARFEIGGHTDSEGSESGNLRLSQERADAVLAALRAGGAPLPGLTAKGYGEGEPVADNGTAEGRAANRRIAFVLVDETADAAVVPAAAPGVVCVRRIEAVLAEGRIEFAPGSAEIAPESAAVIDGIAEALGGCPEVAMEIGGHTDSEGSEAGNERLSQQRADAVLAALRGKGLALPLVTAQGYGESEPVADNATPDGRAANRRIAFDLVTAEVGGGDGSE